MKRRYQLAAALMVMAAVWGTARVGGEGLTARVKGVVLDAETRAPISGASVWLYSLAQQSAEGGYWRDEFWEASTDRNGRFGFEVAAPDIPGRFLLYCRRDGFVSVPPDYYFGGTEESGGSTGPLSLLARHETLQRQW